MQIFTCILLGFLVVCAIAVSFSKNLLNSILIFMSYSLVMSVIWILLESPDLAITEAAVGAGVTSVLFFVTLKKIRAVLENDLAAEAAELDDEEEAQMQGTEEKAGKADTTNADCEKETIEKPQESQKKAAKASTKKKKGRK